VTGEGTRVDVVKYVLVALGLAFAGVGTYVVLAQRPTPDISYRVLALQVGNPEQITVTFEVTRPPTATVECQVTATGNDNDVVNRLNGIRIPPSAERTTTHTVVVPTDAPATAAAVASCVVVG
jgi:hypothetical protein